MDFLEKCNSYLSEHGISMDKGMVYAGESEENYRMLVNVFCECIDDSRKKFQKYLDENDMKSYSIDVHALKSNARSIGADALFEMAYEHELKSKAGDSEFIKSHYDELVKLWDETANVLMGYLEMESEENGDEAEVEKVGTLSLEDLKKSMSMMVKWLEDFDTFMVEDELERIATYVLPEGTQETVDKMNKAMDNFDYDETARLARTLI